MLMFLDKPIGTSLRGKTCGEQGFYSLWLIYIPANLCKHFQLYCIYYETSNSQEYKLSRKKLTMKQASSSKFTETVQIQTDREREKER